MFNFWYSCKDTLPQPYTYVLGYYCGKTWNDKDDDPNYVVVKRVSVPNYEPNNDGASYKWVTFGPRVFLAKDISHWAYIPRV